MLQPQYNLYDRAAFDGALRELCIAEEIGVITYYSLAKGFLSGKYRSEADLGKSPRGGGVKDYLNPRGFRILATLDTIAASHGAKSAEVALAWIISRAGVTAPIASATTPQQLQSLVAATKLALDRRRYRSARRGERARDQAKVGLSEDAGLISITLPGAPRLIAVASLG